MSGYFASPIIPPVEVLALRDVNYQHTGTIAATVIPGSAVTIPAGFLTVGRMLRVYILYDIVTQAQTLISALRLGGTDVASLSSSASSADKNIRAQILGTAIGAQVTSATAEALSGASAGGSLLATAVDMSADVTLDLQITLGATTEDLTVRTILVEAIQV